MKVVELSAYKVDITANSYEHMAFFADQKPCKLEHGNQYLANDAIKHSGAKIIGGISDLDEKNFKTKLEPRLKDMPSVTKVFGFIPAADYVKTVEGQIRIGDRDVQVYLIPKRQSDSQHLKQHLLWMATMDPSTIKTAEASALDTLTMSVQILCGGFDPDCDCLD